MTATGPGEPAAPGADASPAAPGADASPAAPAAVPVEPVRYAPPDPPPGPGVMPPFPAPPTEGRTGRLWLGIGVGAAALVLCCGGGVAAMIGLVAVGERAFNEQATAVIGDYLDALRDEKYDQAYGLLCDELQDNETPAEFAGRVEKMAAIRSYDVGGLSLTSADMEVPVQVVYENGRAGTLRVRLAQDGTTGEFEVCGVEE